MKDYLAEVRDLYDAGKYDEVLSLIEEAESKGSVGPALFVWKSRSLLLTDNPRGGSTDAEEALGKALKLDNEYLPALIDLGYFHLNVMDNPKAALPIFQKALSLCTESATETILGLGQCISEIESAMSGLEFLESNAAIMVNPDRLQELKTELRSYLGSDRIDGDDPG